MEHFKFTVIIFGWLSLLNSVDVSNILAIFPIPVKSRFSFNEAMMRSLSEAGHQITFVSPFPEDERLKNYPTIIDASSKNGSDNFSVNNLRAMRTYDFFAVVREIEEKQCHVILKNEAIRELLDSNQKEFDVMFVDVLYMYECYLPLAQKLDIPVIGTESLRSWKLVDPLFLPNGYNPFISNFYNPATVPFEFVALPKIMTFCQRMRNTWYYLLAEFFRYFVIRPEIHKIYQQYYPTHLWYKKKVSLVFYNNHPTILPKPSVPNAIEIGGVHIKPAKPLPQNIQKFIDESKHGVILFTFGSYITSSGMSHKILSAFKGAFAAIPQRVIWKFEGEVDDFPDNVLAMKWVPQRDILAHENVIGFITHCGISGTYEAIYEGKPLIMIPLIIDQFSNSAILEELGVGVLLDFDSLSKGTILGALNTVVNDTRYRVQMQELSRRFKDRPMTPQQSVVYWTEYVIRHKGASHLRTTAADMPLYQYLLLDIILFGSLIILIILCISYFVIKNIFRLGFQAIKSRDKFKEKVN